MPSLQVPRGFRLGAVHCGIKSDPKREDLTLVVCPQGATGAGVYTQNLVVAAPVLLDRQRTPSADIRVLVVNSGNANACTGERGMRDAEEMARLAAETCGARAEQALVMSTGIIGVFLPMERIREGIRQASGRLGEDEDAFLAATRGIMTTDNGPKFSSQAVEIGGRTVRIAGMAKGAGMIGPHMATLLGCLMTDAQLSPEQAQAALRQAVDRSFNCISVEGHTSTNDTVVLLASGQAETGFLNEADLARFQEALELVAIELARKIPDDGEGATHLISIDVQGCQSRSDALQIARTVANSALVKTAMAGGDPNWGRIVSAAGYAGVPFDPGQVKLTLNGFLLYERGGPVSFQAAEVSRSLRENREVQIELHVGTGPEKIRFWTSDLTLDYVRFNADYHT